MSFLVLCFFITHNQTYAQSDTIRWSLGKHLKLGDFSVEQGIKSGYVDVMLHYSYAFQQISFVRYVPIVEAEAVFSKKRSRLPDTLVTSLRYAQLLFDLSGYESRLIKVRAFKLGELSGNVNAAKTQMDKIFFESSQEVSELRKKLERDMLAENRNQMLKVWENKVAELLISTPEVGIEDRVGKWQIGIYAGIGTSFFNGDTKKFFKNATGLNFGMEADVKRSRFALDLLLGFNKTKIGLEKDGEWPSGMKTTFAGIELSYGYKFQKNKWLLVPYAGLGLNEFAPRKTQEGDKRDIVGYSPMIGIEVNRDFKNLNDPDEKVRFFYKCKLSLNPSNLIRDYGGTQVNLKFAVGFDVSRVRKMLVYKN
ncbi:hypothetical protein [Dyadobacter sp. CY312]|uniref:hypothetical protein n=1 Tax=Dyadobacter sp. CY312 TaxID=2907303 RepID=UPI001F1FFF0E|nr:hypothetical protein [Dyadobacter sp. CY312]MCE7041352.1 hypothetical protein [Dyadobacter sp. CY312]